MDEHSGMNTWRAGCGERSHVRFGGRAGETDRAKCRHGAPVRPLHTFRGLPQACRVAVMDLVTRKWICELVSIEETSTQVQVVFLDALEAEGLLELIEARQDAVAADPSPSLPPLTFSRRCCSRSLTTGRR